MKNLSFAKRLGFALSGIKTAWKSESSFRTQTFAAPPMIAILVYFKAQPIWWAIISLTIGLVLAAELLNTALEHAIDRLHPEQHSAIKIAKDCAAGAVLICSFVSLVVFVSFICSHT